jgi:hypothetical protein
MIPIKMVNAPLSNKPRCLYLFLKAVSQKTPVNLFPDVVNRMPIACDCNFHASEASAASKTSQPTTGTFAGCCERTAWPCDGRAASCDHLVATGEQCEEAQTAPRHRASPNFLARVNALILMSTTRFEHANDTDLHLGVVI